MKITDVPMGAKAVDTISGFEGIVECRSEWLNGCIRVTIAPTSLDKDGCMRKSATFDPEQVMFGNPVRATKPEEARANGPMPEPERR